MLKLMVFLDEHFSDWSFPDSRYDDTRDGAGVLGWFLVVVFFLLFSTASVYVLNHLLRIH